MAIRAGPRWVLGKVAGSRRSPQASQLGGSAWESNPPNRRSREVTSVLKTEPGTSPGRASIADHVPWGARSQPTVGIAENSKAPTWALRDVSPAWGRVRLRGEGQVGDRAVAGEALEAAHEVRANLVLLGVHGLEADLHLDRDLVGFHAALVVELDEGAVLVGEVGEQRVEVLPALLLDQLVERGAIALLVGIEDAVDLVEERAAAGAAQEV